MNGEIIYKYRWQLSLLSVGVILSLTGLIMIKMQSASPAAVEVISESESEIGSAIVVEVAGAVKSPGVYEFQKDDRVADALERAGGISEEADLVWLEKYLNQAAVLQDGQKLYIPRVGEQSLGASAKNIDTTQSSCNNGSAVQSPGTRSVNINSASQEELEALWGIGPVTAQNIIEHRPYSSVEELLQKKILKSNVYERNVDKLSVY